jgi:hypothetical protein
MPFPMWLTWVRRQITWSKSRPHRHFRPPHFRPRLESLEGRWLPSTFVVTTTNDAGAGSFRQAILDADATPGANEIDFSIGGGGAQTIRPTSALPEVSHSVVIDATTQPGFAGAPLIGLDGTNVSPLGTRGLEVRADGCTVKGLAITDFFIHDPEDPDLSTPGLIIAGSGNVVQGNYLGTDLSGAPGLGNGIGLWVQSGSNNLIGGTAPGAGNLISGNAGDGVFISGGGSNVVQGNFIGTDATGTAPLGNGAGVDIDRPDNLVGGTTPAARNIISGNRSTGFVVVERSNRVQGNYIGTDVTGTLALGNQIGVAAGVTILGGTSLIGGTEAGAGNLISGNRGAGVQPLDGIVIQGNEIGTDVTGTRALGNRIGVARVGFSQDSVLVGGTAAGAGNLISGNGEDGVFISTSGFGTTVVQGNRIGTDASGTQALGNASNGVHALDANDGNNTIGGEAPGAGNTIAFNGNDGVLVDGSSADAIQGNSIFANGNLGIELLHGGNHDQAAPVLTSATTDGTSTTITGTLASTPNTTFTLEFFANDPSGVGQRFLGSVQVTTDADGNASFTVTFAVALDPGTMITATATDSANDTSQFSDGVQVTG